MRLLAPYPLIHTAGRCRRQRSRGGSALVAAALSLASPLDAQETADDLMDMDLESLLQLKVTLVSRKAEDPMDAPAAVFVLTAEDIRRSGATGIAEALRLVPGIHVGRINASQWAVSARGFNGRFANKLLVLIDGRSVYTPAFSGVFWEAQDVDLGDVERIEVVRGPGATLWGANAVNGVINIVTLAADETAGPAVAVAAGTGGQTLTARYGGRVARAAYRVYGDVDRYAAVVDRQGRRSGDPWSKAQGGFRFDGDTEGGDRWTLQGGGYSAAAMYPIQTTVQDSPVVRRIDNDAEFYGGHVLGCWRRGLGADGEAALQVYIDHTRRQESTAGERRTTLDADFQHRFAWGRRHDIIWGLGGRTAADRIDATFALEMNPAARRLSQLTGFVQDDIALAAERLRLVVGAKFSYNAFDGLAAQPNVRLLWRPSPRQALWGAFAHALRTPSRGDADATLRLRGEAFGLPAGEVPVIVELSGQNTNESERLYAFEAGYRYRPHGRLSLDIAVFYNRYRGLLSAADFGRPVVVEAPQTYVRIPLELSNVARVDSRGGEAAVTWRPLDAWRLDAHYSLLQYRGRKELSELQLGDPRQQFLLRSHAELGTGWQFGWGGRYVGRLRSSDTSGYAQADVRLARRLGRRIELELVGQNLLHDRRSEFVNELFDAGAVSIERGLYIGLAWQG